MYLIDSDWVATFLKGRAEAIKLMDTLSQEGLAISIITYGEIYEGIYYGANPKRQEKGFQAFLREVEVLPLNKRTMQTFARIRGELRAKGTMIPDPDLLIAATAMQHNLTLVTRNTKHFQRIPGISLYRATAN